MTIVEGADPFKATTMKVDQNDLQNFQTFSFQKDLINWKIFKNITLPSILN
jgi:hypothetical protein